MKRETAAETSYSLRVGTSADVAVTPTSTDT